MQPLDEELTSLPEPFVAALELADERALDD
jgi:hypothetical protein